MKKINLTILHLFVIITCIYPQEKFHRIYESEHQDWGWDLIRTVDEGFAIVGQTSESISNVRIIKTNSIGDILFNRTYGGIEADYGYAIRQTSDSGFIISGQTSSYGAGQYDIYLIRIDNIGDTIWTKTFGGIETDGGGQVEITSDGGFIISGFTYSYGPNWGNVYLIKTDSMGNTLWSKTPTLSSGACFATDLIETSDGGYLITGNTTDNQAFLIKTNSSGDNVWSQTYTLPYSYGTSGESVIETLDGNYLIVGSAYSYSSYSDVLLIKTDLTGDIIWTKTFGDNMYDYGTSVQNTVDSGYIVTGSIDNMNSYDIDIYLINTNSQGDPIWTKTYNLQEHERAYSVKQTPDKGYCITGYTENSSGKQQIFLLKVDNLGNSDIVTAVKEEREFTEAIYFPNPITNELNIQKSNFDKLFIEIIDYNGRTLYQDYYSDKNIIIDMTNYTNGLYLLKLKIKDKIHYAKLIKCNSK